MPHALSVETAISTRGRANGKPYAALGMGRGNRRIEHRPIDLGSVSASATTGDGDPTDLFTNIARAAMRQLRAPDSDKGRLGVAARPGRSGSLISSASL